MDEPWEEKKELAEEDSRLERPPLGGVVWASVWSLAWWWGRGDTLGLEYAGRERKEVGEHS